jgi:hypothetical protein
LRPNRRVRFDLCALVVLASVLVAASGCGYRVAGRTNPFPPGIKVIAVPAFDNHTSTYRIEQLLTNAVVHELLARTSYSVVARPEAGDAVLRGEVIGIGNSAVVFDSVTGRATTILVTVTLRARLEDRATGNVLYRNDNFVFREPYEISTDVPSFFEEEGPALDRMSRDFAARLVSDMLQNF